MKKTIVTIDGNEAAAYGSYSLTEIAAIFPITPSSPMAEYIDLWSSNGKLNIFNSTVKVSELQSEGGASGAVHGALQAGSLATTYTASQGLLLMIPNIYKCVGELLPAVYHVSARSLASRALSIFGDHQDIYAVRQTGATLIASHSVQEAADLAPLAHLVATSASIPVIHFFDGFRTSHEINKIELMDYSEIEKLVDYDAIKAFKARALNPINPKIRGGAENDDIYFQAKEAQNTHFNNVIKVAEDYFKKISKLTGREYDLFTYYGDKIAERVIVAMGSVTETIKEVVDDLNELGEKVGLVKVHLFRPFSVEHLVKTIPNTVKKISVLDRTKEPGSSGEPLYLDVLSSLSKANRKIEVYGGRYGLSSKDTQPNQIKAVYDNLKEKTPLNGFTIGINDDVTNLSLKIDEDYKIKNYYTACLFWGLGSDGTVSANKNTIKIIGNHTDLYSQAYFAYDSRKAGGVTRSHLRFGKEAIRSTYYVKSADFISCSVDNYLFKYDVLSALNTGGTFLLNTSIPKEKIEDMLPNRVKKTLALKKAKFYIIDASLIAREIKMGRNTNTILQSAFFKLTNIINYEDAVKYMKEAAKKSYGKKGDDIVNANYNAIDEGGKKLVEIKVNSSWAKLEVLNKDRETGDDYLDEYLSVVSNLDGYQLPVSTFTKYDLLDGSFRNEVTYREKRNTALEVPTWDKSKCIQCNKCVLVCPHATIRSFLLTKDEIKDPLTDNDVVPALGVKDHLFRIQVSPSNCVGCGLCVTECPEVKDRGKALSMVQTNTQLNEDIKADYLYKKVSYKTSLLGTDSVKGVGFARPYFEISGACAGCGETPYYKLATQLFGKDMIIANATGCSSIYSGSTPFSPFSHDENLEGPAWANSLFEDNAEFGYGMRLSVDKKRSEIKNIINLYKDEADNNLKSLLNKYLDCTSKNEERELLNELVENLGKTTSPNLKKLLEYKDYFVDKSVWIVGGDGWSYDIGFGGLDHVLANNENVNVLILDTEVYSNTGGQSSKSSQTGSIAKFTASGKKTAKKDIASIFMSYGHIYVATVAMGANNKQVIDAMKEAESYNGPSVIIAYSPCAEHGIKGGLKNHQVTQRKAVECGYVIPFRYDPRKENPLTIDCKEPDFNKFVEFVLTESRYSQLLVVNPNEAESLLNKSRDYAIKRYNNLKARLK